MTKLLLKTSLSLLILVTTSTTTVLAQSITSCLEAISGSNTVPPSSPEYETEKLSWNLRFTHDPVAVFIPTSEHHVQEAVKCASQFNINVAPRGGGHSYEGYGQGGKDGSLIIDLKEMNSISVDPAAATATVGPGNRLGRLYVELWDAGEWAFPGGSCPSVGVAGFLLGGGFGFLTNQFGIGTDQIIEMRMVNAKGELLTINAQSNQDLFWALRGAGNGSFGVITSFTVRISRVPGVTTHCYVQYDIADAEAVLSAYTRWAATVPDTLTTTGSIDDSSVQFYGIYMGPSDEAEALFDQVKSEIGANATLESFSEHPLIESHLEMSDMNSTDYRSLADLSFDRSDRYWKSSALMYSRPLAPSTIEVIRRHIERGRVGVDVDYFGGQSGPMSRLPMSENAWIHRDQLFVLQLYTSWGGSGSAPGIPDCTACLDGLREFQNDLIENYRAEYGQEPIRGYQNYPDETLPNPFEAYFGVAFERLQTIKARHDPDEVFKFPMSIPPSNDGAYAGSSGSEHTTPPVTGLLVNLAVSSGIIFLGIWW